MSLTNFFFLLDPPHGIVNQQHNLLTGLSAPLEIPGKRGHHISRTHPDFPLEGKQPNKSHRVSLDRNLKKTHFPTVIEKNDGAFSSSHDSVTQDSSLSSSSRNVTSVKFPLEGVPQSATNVTHLYNVTYPLNYSTNPRSSSQIIRNNLSYTEDTSTRSKAKRGRYRKEQTERKLLSSRQHDSVRKSAHDITETYIKSRKKKRRKYSTPIHSNNHHRRHTQHHHRKVKLQRPKFAVSDEIKKQEYEFTKKRRSLPLATTQMLVPGASERALLRFKRKSLLYEKEPSKNHKKRKRKKRQQALRVHPKQRSLPSPNVFNAPMSRFTTGYQRNVVWRRRPGFVENTNSIPGAKYDQLRNRGETSSLLLNPYGVSSDANRYGWRKSVPNANKPSSSVLSVHFGDTFSKKGQVQLALFSPETRNLESQPAMLSRFQNARTQIQKSAKFQHVPEGLQKSNVPSSNGLSRKQFIPGTRQAFYGYVPQLNYQPQLLNPQMALAANNPRALPYSQSGPITTPVKDLSSVLPERNNHIISEGEALRRSRGPQGLVMYLNFDDTLNGKAAYASFNGDVDGEGRRTEISRSFGSCGKVAKINNGSEILLNGGQIKVRQIFIV